MTSYLANNFNWAAPCENAQSDQGLRCPQIELMNTIKCFNGEKMPERDFAHVQGDVNPHILRMLECTFSLDAAQLI